MKPGFQLIIIFSLFFIGCRKSISFPEFDDNIWKGDKGGCTGERIRLIDNFVKNKNQLKGYSSAEIITFLGKPDKEDLYSRNQKFYYYYVERGLHCSNAGKVSDSKRIVVRFSAMDRATEVSYVIK